MTALKRCSVVERRWNISPYVIFLTSPEFSEILLPRSFFRGELTSWRRRGLNRNYSEDISVIYACSCILGVLARNYVYAAVPASQAALFIYYSAKWQNTGVLLPLILLLLLEFRDSSSGSSSSSLYVLCFSAIYSIIIIVKQYTTYTSLNLLTARFTCVSYFFSLF